jgi:two-component system cell cycle sensor histidine kinase/response regulator CckA
MKKKLRVLIVEDSELDAALMVRQLKSSGYDVITKRVETKQTFLSALESEPWDAILCDYRMPDFDGMTALELFKEQNLDIPFIMVSATMSEDLIVEALRAGAHDYVMKAHLNRLNPAIERELHESEVRRESVQTTQALRESEIRYRSLFENMSEGYAYCKMLFEDNKPIDFIYMDVNAKFAELTGLKDVVGKTVSEVIPGIQESNPELFECYGRVALTGKPEKLEPYVKPLGIWFSVSVYSPEREYFVAVFENVTERKQAEESLRESEERYRALFTFSPDALYVHVDRRIALVNPSLCQLLGADDPSLLIGKSVFEIVHPEYHEELRQRWNLVFGGQPAPLLEEKFIRLDGTLVDVEVSAVAIDWEGSKAVQVIARDVTERKRMEDELRKSEERFRKIFDESQVGIITSAPDYRFEKINPAFCRMIGYSANELASMTFADITHPDDIRKDIENVKKLGLGEISFYKAEKRYLRKTGEIIWGNVVVSSVRNIKGTLLYYLAMIEDISERKRAEEAIRESEERFRMVFENVFDGISIYSEDPDPSKRRLVECNDRYAAMAGRSREELLQRGSTQGLQITHEETANIKRLESLAAGKAYQGSFSWIRPDGNDNIVEYVGVPITWRGKSHSIGIDRDITERKRSEQQINLLAHTVRSIGECVSITDLNDTILFVNDSFLKTYGYAENEILGKNINIIGSPNNPPGIMSELRNAARETGWQGELLNRAKDGREFTISLSTSLVRDDNGRTVALVGVAADITERKRVEEALTYERNLLKALMDNIPDHVYFKDKQSHFLRMSRSQANRFGLDEPEQAIGKTDFDFFAEEHARPAFEDEQRIMKSGIAMVGVEEKESWPDGGESWVSTTKVPLQDAESQIIGTFGISRDITKNKEAEKALKESEEKYRSLFERNLAATFVSTPEGRVLDCNPAYVQMFGFESYDQAKSTNLSRLYADPKNRELMLTTLQTQKKAEDLQLRMAKMDGTPMYVIANVVGKFDENGRLVQKTGYLIDDTKRHRLEKELIQSQKLESLGILAGGIAHDFNNILGILMGHVSLLDRIKDNPELQRTSLDAIDTALKRGTSLVRQLLTFARKSDVEFAPLLVNDIVKELIRLLRETLPRTIEIVADLNPRLPAIVADGGQIHQVLLNLCVNARDAMHTGGRIRIQTNLVEGSLVRQRFPVASAEKYVSIEVRDTGTGMDEATKTRIFEPFFTTKESGKGTGLGLAVVFGVVQTHKGYIDVESEIGQGSAFRVFLPVEITESTATDRQKARFEESRGGQETILVVEDETLLYETTKMVLVSKGYEVLYAREGFEAIDVYRKHFKEIHLVLTDMDLPKLGGEQLIKTLLEINPKLKVIFSSGYVEPEVKARLLESGAKAFLAKPYDPLALLAKVRAVLDGNE